MTEKLAITAIIILIFLTVVAPVVTQVMQQLTALAEVIQ